VVVGNLGVADHWGFLCWSRLQYSTGGSITDRVYYRLIQSYRIE
jgi:hypothetical protein